MDADGVRDENIISSGESVLLDVGSGRDWSSSRLPGAHASCRKLSQPSKCTHAGEVCQVLVVHRRIDENTMKSGMNTAIGPVHAEGAEPLSMLSRDAVFAPPPEPLHELLLLDADEQVVQVAPLANAAIAVLTSKAVYMHMLSTGGNMIGKLFDSVFSSTPRVPPKARQGYQQWRSVVANAVITRVDLTLVEAVSVRKSHDGAVCALCCSVPRSAVPHLEQHFPPSTAKDAAAKHAAPPRASLLIGFGDETECRVWQCAVREVVHARWQRLLEAVGTGCVPAPEVYQIHARAKLLPKGRGAPLSRLLVLSDRHIISVKREGTALRTADWRAEFARIGHVEQHLAAAPPDRGVMPQSYPVGLSVHWAEGKAPDGSVEAFFALKSREEAAALAAGLRHAHLQATGKSLRVVVHGQGAAGGM